MRKDLEMQQIRKSIQDAQAVEQEKYKEMQTLNLQINDMDIDLENNSDVKKFA